MSINEAMSICFKNGIKVYPVIYGKKHKIEYSLNGKSQTRYEKILQNSKEISIAMKKTYVYLANKTLK
jgi:hypothetical protein